MKVVPMRKNMKTEQEALYRIKVQRPQLSTVSTTPPLLIYSRDGQIPPTMVPLTEARSNLLGERNKVYFLASLDNGDLVLRTELFHDNW